MFRVPVTHTATGSPFTCDIQTFIQSTLTTNKQEVQCNSITVILSLTALYLQQTSLAYGLQLAIS